MNDSIVLEDFKKVIPTIYDTIQENADYLCELDSNVGDGDHGTTIARGLKSARHAVAEGNAENISPLFVSL